MEIDESDFVIFDEEKSRELVIDFIQANPGCIAEDILRGQNQIRRKKLFRILPDLKEENVIIEEQGSKPKTRNAKKVRNKKLFVNGANPLTVIHNELEEFEQLYYLILERTTDVFNKKRADAIIAIRQATKRPPYHEFTSSQILMWQPFHIFIGFLKTYLTRLMVVWSKVIQDKDVISKIYSMVFAKFAQIQSRSFKIMVSSVSEEIVSNTTSSSYTAVQSSTTQELREHIRKLKKYGVEEESKELLDFLKRTNTYESIREYFLVRNKPFRWDLQYKEDEMKSFFEDMNEHADDMYDALHDDYLESLEE